MRRLTATALVVLSTAVAAVGQAVPSTIAYTLELGGNNHVADWENVAGKVTTAFTPGLAADGQSFGFDFDWDHLITWDVVVTSAGQTAEGLHFQGVANLTFNIELQDAAGAAVAGNRFFSTMNDGDTVGYRRFVQGVADPFEKAAFCLGWDVDTNHDGVLDGVFGPAIGEPGNPGRLFDPPTAAGPGMDRVQFPSNTFHGGGRLKGSDTNYWRDCNGNNPSLALTDFNGDTRKDDLDEIGLGLAVDANNNGIIDACENGLVSLPGTAGEPLSENKLSGMGIGYSEYREGSNDIGVGLAVGSTVTVWGGTIGLNANPAIPVAEGQINMEGLPAGTYKLVLTAPTNSNNVMAATYLPTPAGAGGFAVRAEQVVTDEIIFNWVPCCCCAYPVRPIAWKSVRTHGAAGEQAIALNPTPTGGVWVVSETRNNGIRKIAIVFDGDLTKADYAAGGVVISPNSLSVAPGGESLATTMMANDTLLLTLQGSVDQTCYTINVAGVCWIMAGADVDCRVAHLTADTNGDKSSNLIDVAHIKSKNGQPLAGNAKFDLNTDGFVDLIDMALAKSRNGKTVSCP